jgi:hypothetical protein
MVDQTGHSAIAIAASSTALSTQHAAVAEADRGLSDALAAAHTVTVESLRRLDAIEADIDAAVAHQDTLGLDAPAGAKEFHRFLLAKHREIIDIVATAAAEAESKKAVLQGLLANYPAASTI